MIREEISELPTMQRFNIQDYQQSVFSIKIIRNYDIGEITLNSKNVLIVRYLKHIYIREDLIDRVDKKFILTPKDEVKPVIEGKRIDPVSEFKSDTHRLYHVCDIAITHP